MQGLARFGVTPAQLSQMLVQDLSLQQYYQMQKMLLLNSFENEAVFKKGFCLQQMQYGDQKPDAKKRQPGTIVSQSQKQLPLAKNQVPIYIN